MAENTNAQRESDFPKIGQPALRALNGAGYVSLEQLTEVSKANLSKLHGMGPKALGVIERYEAYSTAPRLHSRKTQGVELAIKIADQPAH